MGSCILKDLFNDNLSQFSKRTIYMLRLLDTKTKNIIDDYLSRVPNKLSIYTSALRTSPDLLLGKFFYIKNSHYSWDLYHINYFNCINNLRLNSTLFDSSKLINMTNLLKLTIPKIYEPYINNINKLSSLTTLNINIDTNINDTILKLKRLNLKKLKITTTTIQTQRLNLDIINNTTLISIKIMNFKISINTSPHLIKFKKITLDNCIIDCNMNKITSLQNINFIRCAFAKIIKLPSIQKLCFFSFSDRNIDDMIKLKDYDITKLRIYNKIISDFNLMNFISLTELKINNCIHITDSSIAKLTNLEKLSVHNQRISGDCFRALTQLSHLNFYSVIIQSDVNLLKLTNLTKLNITNTNITPVTIEKLVNLQHLIIHSSYPTLHNHLSNLTNLKKLSLCGNYNITYDCLSKMEKLVTLSIYVNNIIEFEKIGLLTNLINLQIHTTSDIRLKQQKLKQLLINTDIIIK